MNKPPTDTSGLGYSYHLPSGGLLLRIRNSLSQFSDLFSEFNRYLAPAYHHDRCERSVHMRLYSMHKREFVMVFMAFFACFGLGIFIGIAGPPITAVTEVDAKTLQNATSTKGTEFLASGPFVLKTKLLTTYSQQMWVIARIETENTDDEVFDKSFHVSVAIDGVTEEHKLKTILHRDSVHNRTRHLVCVRKQCDEFIVLHLGFLEYAHYILTVNFYGLEAFHQRYNIHSLKFFFKTYNPEFTQIEIWFRFIFLLFTFIVTCWFAHTLRKHLERDWSIEQKWMSVLLPLLVFYNNPFFPLIFLYNSWFPGFLDAIYQATFLCSLLMFWLCVYHGLRQNERKFLTFYLPKIILIMPMWLCSVILATWEKCNELKDPTFSHFIDTGNYNNLKTFFYISAGVYVVYLLMLLFKAYSELRSMPYFDMRLKFLTIFMLFVLCISLVVTMNRFGFSILEDNFVASLNTTYKSSAQFMCFYGLLNFYLYSMAYVYSPSGRQVHEPTITKDNPAFSMINDSDEEVVYGSGDESRRLTGNEYDSD